MVQEVQDFQTAVTGVGTAVADVKAKAAALHKAIDDKVEAIGKQAATDLTTATAITAGA